MPAPQTSAESGPQRVRVHNPERPQPGEMTAKEREIQSLAAAGTPQQRTVYDLRHYEYRAPFNYANCSCETGRDGTGTGAHPEGMEMDIPPFAALTIEESEPIISVDVIGSPCIPPGTVLLYGEPREWNLARPGVRYKVNNLWGEHLYGWGDSPKFDTGNRHSGLVSAHFEIPDCTKITLMGYGQLDVHVSMPGKGITAANEVIQTPTGEEWWNDAHFNLYAVRVAVRVGQESS
jgi:hypothetical protein